MSCPVESLPVQLLVEILEFVPFLTERRFLSTCQRLWQQRFDIVSRRRRLFIEDNVDILLCKQAAPAFTSLVELDLQEYASDVFLQATEEYLPSLERLLCVGSQDVTDIALRTLKPRYKPRLRYLDITFCQNTTYQATLGLRRDFSGITIRRQPKWMDGHFQTPFANDGLHTYWCDGSFSFVRDSLKGYVMKVRRFESDNSHHVYTKLQMSNFQSPPRWADWTRYVYRPGVSLLHDPQSPIDDDDQERTVLVAQAQRGIRAPRHWPKVEHFGVLPIGVSVYFDRRGQQVSEENSDVMVTRMRVLPLESLMPPEDVVAANEHFLTHSWPDPAGDHSQEIALERLLHAALGGNRPGAALPDDDDQDEYIDFLALV